MATEPRRPKANRTDINLPDMDCLLSRTIFPRTKHFPRQKVHRECFSQIVPVSCGLSGIAGDLLQTRQSRLRTGLCPFIEPVAGSQKRNLEKREQRLAPRARRLGALYAAFPAAETRSLRLTLGSVG